MPIGLTLVAVDDDEDYLGVSAVAKSDRFSASTRLYLAHNELGALAESIRGFPTFPGDSRTVELGEGDPKLAGGHLVLKLKCASGVGHPELHVKVRDDGAFHQEARAEFSLRFEASALDRFVSELEGVHKLRTGEAFLQGLG